MFDRQALIEACTAHGTVARVVVADVAGSAPREVGAAMLVWQGGQSGTIGGGALEYDLARSALAAKDGMSRHALGPDMGQCCGGSVHVLTEIYDLERALALPEDMIVRGVGEMPLQVQRLIAQARNQGIAIKAQRFGSWFVEGVHKPIHAVWIWGAGHVGRALVDVLSPLPDYDITWVDTAMDRFPEKVPKGVSVLPTSKPVDVLAYADPCAHHLILTYSHAIDLALCDGLLSHGFQSCGLIGSATKWARFRKRLESFGHNTTQIKRIQCPIGDPLLGKQPQAIAIGVAGQLMKENLETMINKQEATF